jgi:hypothetical protein
VKEFKPQMNADEHRLKTGILSALICVYLRLKTFFLQFLRQRLPAASVLSRVGPELHAAAGF